MYLRIVQTPAGLLPVKLGAVFSVVCFSVSCAVTCEVSFLESWLVVLSCLLFRQSVNGGGRLVRQRCCVVMVVAKAVAVCLYCCLINVNGLFAIGWFCCFHPSNE